MEQSGNGSLEFWSTSSVNGGGTEGFPDNGFANVCGDEERDTGAKTVALLQELVKEDDDESGRDELEDEEKADTRSKGGRGTVETGEDSDGCLAEGDD